MYVDDRTIDSHIKRLRKKFKQVDDDFDVIETLYGVGYASRKLEAPDGGGMALELERSRAAVGIWEGIRGAHRLANGAAAAGRATLPGRLPAAGNRS